MAFNNGAQKALGIEYAPERHQKAIEMYNKLKTKIKPGDMERFNNIRYINGDILNNNELNLYLKNTNVVYISNLCFTEDLNISISKVLKLLPKMQSYFVVKRLKEII